MDKILYISGHETCIWNEDNTNSKFESEYVNRYKNSLVELKKKDEWKYSGSGAQFRQAYNFDESQNVSFDVASIAPFDENNFVYSVSASSGNTCVSGIVQKNSKDGKENHILHSNSQQYGSIDYDKGNNTLAISCKTNSQTQDIAIFDIKSNNLRQLTSGDSIDENPSFSKNSGKILYNSYGIGRNNAMEAIAFSDSSIYALTQNGSFESVLSEPKKDLIMPKNDKNGNLYYIKKPHKDFKQGKSFFATLLDIILLPYWLIVGFVKILFFFANIAKTSTKKNSAMTSGANPSVMPSKSEREMYIHNQLIDIEKEEKRNQRTEKNAGFAPKCFELWILKANGDACKLRNGVLDYDVDQNGNLVYTNGRYVFLKEFDGEEKVLFKERLVTKVKFFIFSLTEYQSDPFSSLG